MKTLQFIPLIGLAVLPAISLPLSGHAAPLGTAFSYQGRLTDGTNAANGLYDLDFALFDVPDGGGQLGLSMTYSGQPVSNGLFTVTLDFGASPFHGEARWLQIQVRTNGGRTPPPYTILSPRQALTPAPYALYAPSAGSAVTASNVAPLSITAGNIADGTITAGKLASGQVVKSLNGLFDVVTLSAGTNVTLTSSGNDLKVSATPGTVVTNAGWGISGNSGTTAANFLGTTDGRPLELKVNAQRVLRLEPTGGSPNTIGGSAANVVAAGALGATIAGGGGAGISNRVAAGGSYGAIGGGAVNSVVGLNGTVPGGLGNTAGPYSFAAGWNAQATNKCSFVWSDFKPLDTEFGSAGDYTFNVRAQNGVYFSPETSLFFGNQVRQMLNLWGATYGIGVQTDTLYLRSQNDFSWFKGGTHDDGRNNPGAGGTELMRLNNAGELFVNVLTIRGGADVAEPFTMSAPDIPKGAVVIIDDAHPGRLKISERAYDTRVAGIVSGANGVNPGLSLSQPGIGENGQNVALSGRVYVLADASTAPIRPGDLLTTSGRPGFAMRVTDSARAQGAILGKAMEPLAAGQGPVLVLVTLQ